MRIEKNVLLLILILFLASVLRLSKLGEIPYGVTPDESGFIYNAYSIFKTGRDVNGKFLPLSINVDVVLPAVPAYIIAPSTGLLGVSPFSGRLPITVIGILTILVVFLLTKELFKNEKIAFLSAIFLTISPWHIQVSRSAYDAPIAMFFFLLGIYIFIKNLEKGNVNWSLPVFFLAFHSYNGTKVFFIFLIPIILLINGGILFKKRSELLVFLGGIFLVLSSYFLVAKTETAVSRNNVFIWNNPNIATNAVNWERDKNTAPYILREVFSNKPLYFLRVIRENYLEAFSSQFLFLYGDTGPGGDLLSLHGRGQLYFIELPLLIIGLLYLLGQKNKFLRNFIFLFLLISPLPSTFTIDKSYVTRSIMMLFPLAILVGCGLYQVINFFSTYKRCQKLLMIGSFVIIYLFFFIFYLYQYFYRYPIYGDEVWFGSNRRLSNFINETGKNYNRILIANARTMFILQYAIYTQIPPETIQKTWMMPSPKRINSMYLLEKCINNGWGNPNTFLEKNTMYIVSEKCHEDVIPSAMIKDFGEPLRTIWKIYEKY